jgi:hypothetical protein
MRRGRVVAVVGVAMMVMVMTVVVMMMAVGMGVRHDKMLYYNITQVHLTGRMMPASYRPSPGQASMAASAAPFNSA